MIFTESEKLFQRAKQVIPGGVNSPVRAFKSVGGNPVFIRSAKGAYLYDEDGNKYIDYINSWGPMILGHAYQPIVDAVKKKLDDSFSFGAPTCLEVEMAELIKEMVPNMERIRMVSSGTEACMSALRLARGFTGRNKVIKFTGCYHGHADSFLIKAGSGALTLGTPDSFGVTQGTAADTLIARYNDLQSVKDLVENNKNQIAALIIEPVAGNMGCVPPKEGFLQELKEICTREGILLIFDEVMTGFRLSAGGVQQLYGVKADLVTYGKIIGGGMPVGAFGGSAEIMDLLAPLGPVYQAGTLSGNPIAMASGYAMLKELHEHPEIYAGIDSSAEKLELGMSKILRNTAIPFSINRVGSMISLHFSSQAIVDLESAMQADNQLFRILFHAMLKRGVYLPPSPFESWFVSHAITEVEIQSTLKAFEESVEELIKTKSQN